MLTFDYYSVFMLVVYNFIHRFKAPLDYNLLLQLDIKEKTEELIYEIIYA